MYRSLFLWLLVLACGFPAAAQLKTTKIPTFRLKHRHLVDFKCEGEPDRVYGHRDKRYFGCVNGKVACSDDAITQSMIANYEANRAEFLADAERRKQEHEARHRRTSHSRPSSTSASIQTLSVQTVPTPPRPPAQTEPIEADQVRQVTVGTSTDDVVSMLGQPKWRLAGSTERWTYSLTSGESAKLVFEGDKVTSVVVP